jgi:hypothetical protein
MGKITIKGCALIVVALGLWEEAESAPTATSHFASLGVGHPQLLGVLLTALLIFVGICLFAGPDRVFGWRDRILGRSTTSSAYVTEDSSSVGSQEAAQPNQAPLFPPGRPDDYSPRAAAMRKSLALRSTAAQDTEAPSEEATSMSRSIEQLAQAAVLAQHQRAEHLASLYHAGTRLQTAINVGRLRSPADAFYGTSNERQAQREQEVRQWDQLVLEALPESMRAVWKKAGVPPGNYALALIEPTTNITDLTNFLTAKQRCLKNLVAQLGEQEITRAGP